MASRERQTTVTDTAGPIDGTQYPFWLLVNLGSETVYLGSSSVTDSTGFPVEAGGALGPSDKASESLFGRVGDALYGVTASSTADIRVLVMGRIDA